MTPFRITGVRFRAASSLDERAGLIGWSSFLLNDAVRLGSVAVRRTRAGRFVLAFPTRRDRQGVEHAVVCPISHDSHRALESAVLDELRRRGVIR